MGPLSFFDDGLWVQSPGQNVGRSALSSAPFCNSCFALACILPQRVLGTTIHLGRRRFAAWLNLGVDKHLSLKGGVVVISNGSDGADSYDANPK